MPPSGVRNPSLPTRRESLSLSDYELLAKVKRDSRKPVIGKINLLFMLSIYT